MMILLYVASYTVTVLNYGSFFFEDFWRVKLQHLL